MLESRLPVRMESSTCKKGSPVPDEPTAVNYMFHCLSSCCKTLATITKSRMVGPCSGPLTAAATKANIVIGIPAGETEICALGGFCRFDLRVVCGDSENRGLHGPLFLRATRITRARIITATARRAMISGSMSSGADPKGPGSGTRTSFVSEDSPSSAAFTATTR